MGTYIIGEVIKRNRESRCISRNLLCEGICSLETLCRIENGHRSPNRINFQALMERMERSGDKYIQFINSNEVDIIKKAKELELLIASRRYSDADYELIYLKRKIDLNNNINRQLIIRSKAIIDYNLGRIGVKEKRKMLLNALSCTLPLYENKELNGIYSRTEIKLYCNIAATFFQEENYDAAIEQLIHVKEYFDNTNIDLEERSISETLMLSNLAQCLSKKGNIMESLELCDKAINLCITTRKGGILPNLLYNKAYNYEIMHKDKECCIKLFMQAYYMAELNNDEKTMIHIQKHINENYPLPSSIPLSLHGKMSS